MSGTDPSPWPFRIFMLIFGVVGVLELARNGVTLPAGFYVLGTVGLALAGGWTGTITPGKGRRLVGLGLVGIGSVLMLFHLIG